MRWNPFVNAILAAAYIWGIALLFQFIQSVAGNVPDSILNPIAALSLLVFSAALMGSLFFYHPVILLLENKKREAVLYFLKTIGIFGAISILVVAILAVL